MQNIRYPSPPPLTPDAYVNMRRGGVWNNDSGPIGLTFAHNNTSDGHNLQQLHHSMQSKNEIDAIKRDNDVIVCTPLSPSHSLSMEVPTMAPVSATTEGAAALVSCVRSEEVQVTPISPFIAPNKSTQISSASIPNQMQEGQGTSNIQSCNINNLLAINENEVENNWQTVNKRKKTELQIFGRKR